MNFTIAKARDPFPASCSLSKKTPQVHLGAFSFFYR